MSRTVKLAVLAVITMLSSIILTGCWDRREINDIAFVLSSAFDRSADNQYRFSAMFALPGHMGGEGGGGGGTGGKNSYFIDSETGSTVHQSLFRLQKRMSRRAFFGHRRSIIISEALAKDGIANFFDFIVRNPENRLSTYVVISKGEAINLLKAKPQFERFSAEAIRELAKAPFAIDTDLKQVAEKVGKDGSDPIIIYMGVQQSGGEEKNDEIAVLGYAQFKGDRMVGVFENGGMLGLSWLIDKPGKYNTTVEVDNGKKATLQVYEGKTDIRPLRNGDHMKFRIEIHASARVKEDQSGLNFSEAHSYLRLNRLLADGIRQDIQAAISQMQRLQTDSASFGVLVNRYYPELWNTTLKDEWRQHLADCEFEYSIQAKVTESGMVERNVTEGGGENL
jgi:spore germination protein KC/spore germination protein